MSHAPHLTPERVEAIYEHLGNELSNEQMGDIMPALSKLCGWALAFGMPAPPLTRQQATEIFFQEIKDYAAKFAAAAQTVRLEQKGILPPSQPRL